MKKILVLLYLLTALSYSGRTQSLLQTMYDDRKPISNQMFQLNPEQYNHHFDFQLPNDGRLLVDFLRLSDWGEQNQLGQITGIAAAQAKAIRDSFTSDYSSKLLEMNIPIDGKIIALSYAEETGGKKQMAYKDGVYYQLKTGFDTIRVIKNVGIRAKPLVDSGLIQVQYTFVLKDISDIEILATHPEAIETIGRLADEAIAKQKKRWHNPDAIYNRFDLKYVPGDKKPMQADNHDGAFMAFTGRMIGIYIGFGAAVYNNNTSSISPYIDETVAYLIPSRTRLQPFVGINLTTFGFLTSNSVQKVFTSYNLEYGVCGRKSRGFIQQRTSLVVGLMTIRNTGDPVDMFHLGFNFGFNGFLSAGFSVASDFKKDSKNGLLNINFKFNL